MKTCKIILISLAIFNSTTANSFFNRFWLVRPAVVLGVTYGCLKLKNWVWPTVSGIPNDGVPLEEYIKRRLAGTKSSQIRPKKASDRPNSAPGSYLGGEPSGAARGTVTGPRPAVRVPVDGRNLLVQAEQAVMKQFKHAGKDPNKYRDDFNTALFCELDFLIAKRAAERSATDSRSLRK